MRRARNESCVTSEAEIGESGAGMSSVGLGLSFTYPLYDLNVRP